MHRSTEFCGNLYDDTNAACPHCGAANPCVRYDTFDNPATIEGLKKWYEAMNLPPYETTRFFIGINYRGRRAFGIYRDENTGYFVVYKNKDDGSQTIRYEGTDEAFAVNELLTRLKQEILHQKSGSVSYEASAARGGRLFKVIGIAFGLMVFFSTVTWIEAFAFFFVMSHPDNIINRASYPVQGYYEYTGKMYYHMCCYSAEKWIIYSEEYDDWGDGYSYTPDDLKNKKIAEQYLVSKIWDPSLSCSDASKSLLYTDFASDYKIKTGYFAYDDTNYYHVDDSQYNGWYYYDDSTSDWSSIGYESIPSELRQAATASDFWYTPVWNSETQITDFTGTPEYYQYIESKNSSSDSSSSSDYS